MSDVLDCGHKPTVTRGLDTGVAYDSDDKSMCYACAYVETMDKIVMTGVQDDNLALPVVYMSNDGRTVTTWDGQFIGHVTHHGRYHNFTSRHRGTRHHIQVQIIYGADVVHAYGVGGRGEYCVLRRFKSDLKVEA